MQSFLVLLALALSSTFSDAKTTTSSSAKPSTARKSPTTISMIPNGCTASPLNPHATSLNCGVQGTVKTPQVAAYGTQVSNYNDCAEQCSQNPGGKTCISFAYFTSNASCTFYTATLDVMGIKRSTSGPLLYNHNCFSHSSGCSSTKSRSTRASTQTSTSTPTPATSSISSVYTSSTLVTDTSSTSSTSTTLTSSTSSTTSSTTYYTPASSPFSNFYIQASGSGTDADGELAQSADSYDGTFNLLGFNIASEYANYDDQTWSYDATDSAILDSNEGIPLGSAGGGPGGSIYIGPGPSPQYESLVCTIDDSSAALNCTLYGNPLMMELIPASSGSDDYIVVANTGTGPQGVILTAVVPVI